MQTTVVKVKTLISIQDSMNELLDLVKSDMGWDKSETIERAVLEYVRSRLEALGEFGLDTKKATELIKQCHPFGLIPEI